MGCNVPLNISLSVPGISNRSSSFKPRVMSAIGIDLGTTNTVVAYMKNDKQVEIIVNHRGNKITPSVVHFGLTGKDVGEEAQAKRARDPKNTVFRVKRLIGRRVDDPEIAKCSFPFEIVGTENGDAAVRVTPTGGVPRIYCPEEISAIILKYAAVLARTKMGLPEDAKLDAVITVPANFQNTQREATKDAGEMAGLNVLRIINEPTAAALAYGFGSETAEKRRTVLVYDLGGGTFDVSIVKCTTLGGKVLATEGLTALGGEDFDERLYKHACAELKGRGITVSEEERFGLCKSCQEAKVTLSNNDHATISLFRNGERDDVEITRQAFEELCIDLFEKTIECVDKAIKVAGIPKESIDDIVLVGGSTRIPKVKQMVREFFGDRELRFNIPADHAVACGAAILAASLTSSDSASSANESTAATRPDRPALRGSVRLADVLPYSLGTNVSYDTMSVILKKNTAYPTSRMESYSNGSDGQTEMIFKILEGEHACCSENRLLGVCKIRIPKRIVGENTVVSIYSVDENGILSVYLRDLDTNEEEQTRVLTSRLTVEERRTMMRNALKEEECERIEKAKLDARNAFGEAVNAVKTSVHKTDSPKKKLLLHTLITAEEKWMNATKNPSNEELIERAASIKKKLQEIMKP